LRSAQVPEDSIETYAITMRRRPDCVWPAGGRRAQTGAAGVVRDEEARRLPQEQLNDLSSHYWIVVVHLRTHSRFDPRARKIR
jgi:hypothetical protein